MAMFESPNLRNDTDREKIAALLNRCLADLLALQSFAKLAHWNVRGPAFGSLHPLFDKLADDCSAFADRVAERCAMLGALAIGTPSQVQDETALEEYPVTTTDGIEHARALFDRTRVALEMLNEARSGADAMGGVDTFQLLTDVVMGLERHGWMLIAHTHQAPHTKDVHVEKFP